MSPGPFPEHLDALKLFARQGVIEAELPLGKLRRFSEYLHDHGGAVSVLLQFGHDEEGRKLLSGSLDAEVQMLCQRCLEAMPVVVSSSFQLLVLETAQAAENADAEAVFLENGQLEVLKLIEDELIISLPLVPAHEDAECSTELNNVRSSLQRSAGPERNNPFSVLAALKTQGAKDREGE